MRHVIALSLLAMAVLIAPGWAETAGDPVPTPEQITAALRTPDPAFQTSVRMSIMVTQPGAMGTSGCDPMMLTPGMLKCPSRGVHSAPSTSTPEYENDACPEDIGICAPRLLFEFASWALSPQSTAALDAVGKVIMTLPPDLRFVIGGYTDTVGPAHYNELLSERRAKAAANYLASRWGVLTTRMIIVGWGELHPLIATGDDVPEPVNRRVQFAIARAPDCSMIDPTIGSLECK